MSSGVTRAIVQYSWYLLLGVWLIGALTAKRQVRTQPFVPRMIHRLLLLLSFFLIFTPFVDFSFLGQRFLPGSMAIAETGMCLTLAGIAFALWARFFLGANWSAAPSVKENHHLIRGGPYAIVRHPIYSGLLLAMLGTALAVGKWRTLLGLAIISVAWHFKSRTEEHYMEQEFGVEYQRYRHEVKGLIPFLL